MNLRLLLCTGLGLAAAHCGDEEVPSPAQSLAGLWVECRDDLASDCQQMTLPPPSCDKHGSPLAIDGVGAFTRAEPDRSSSAEPPAYCLDGVAGTYTYDGTIFHTVADSFDGPKNVALDRRLELVGDYFRISHESDPNRCGGIYRRIAAPPTKLCDS